MSNFLICLFAEASSASFVRNASFVEYHILIIPESFVVNSMTATFKHGAFPTDRIEDVLFASI